jgi:hypothetical protein
VGDAWACWAGLKEAGELDSTDSQGLPRFPELTGLPGLRGEFPMGWEQAFGEFQSRGICYKGDRR